MPTVYKPSWATIHRFFVFAQTPQERVGQPLVVVAKQREETALGGLLCEPLGYRWRPLRQLELASVDLGEPRFRAPSDVAKDRGV